LQREKELQDWFVHRRQWRKKHLEEVAKKLAEIEEKERVERAKEEREIQKMFDDRRAEIQQRKVVRKQKETVWRDEQKQKMAAAQKRKEDMLAKKRMKDPDAVDAGVFDGEMDMDEILASIPGVGDNAKRAVTLNDQQKRTEESQKKRREEEAKKKALQKQRELEMLEEKKEKCCK